ncbi:MAG: hydroxyacid dehydrogenase [Acidimicrobiia bacterium]
MVRVVVSELMDGDVVAGMTAWAEVTYDPAMSDALRGLLADADGLIVRNVTRVTRALLDEAPRLRVVGRLGTGTDNIDLAACADRGIQVRTATGANAVAVAEHALGAMLALMRPALVTGHRVIAGEWPRQLMVGHELSGRRLGIVGVGAIGSALAERAAALGMPVVGHDPFIAEAAIPLVDLDALAARSDVLALHVPLTPLTRGIVDGVLLDRLPPGALVIDCSRGGVVDHAAVIDRLRSGALGGAALDVFPNEPVDAGSGATYAAVPNLILTPHVAGLTVESNRRVSSMVAEAVRGVLAP